MHSAPCVKFKNSYDFFFLAFPCAMQGNSLSVSAVLCTSYVPKVQFKPKAVAVSKFSAAAVDLERFTSFFAFLFFIKSPQRKFFQKDKGYAKAIEASYKICYNVGDFERKGVYRMANQNPLVNLPTLLLPWYEQNKRDLPWRRDREPYHVWISEIMLQQTRVEAVKGYYARFLTALPTIEALANVPEEELLKLWEGLGYYNRARNLKAAAQQIMEEHGGKFPEDYESIRALKGIGDYTAGAISSICFEMPRAAVDGNVLRIAARLLADETPIDLQKTKTDLAKLLEEVYPKGQCGAFTQSLMELGATVCTPRAWRCEACPAKEICKAYAQDTVQNFPVKLPKKEKRVEEKTVFLFSHDGKLAIEKRKAKGLLAGLWQFPNSEQALSPEAALQAADEMGVHPVNLIQEVHKTHIFTHIRWEMTGYKIECAEENEKFIWASEADFKETYALPTAFRMFLED